MKALSPNQIALLLPITILIHQLEEYFGHFPLWYSKYLDVNLSNQNFILINAIGLFVFTAAALSYLFNKNKIILVALGTLVFVNGIVHALLSLFTFTYSPGTISGLLLFIPLGIIIFNRIMPQLRKADKIIAVTIGIFVLFSVSLIAINI